jgi:hypothetical protein
MRKGSLIGAAVLAAATGLTVGATPAAASTVITLPLPWELSWSGGEAAGTFTAKQPPLGITRSFVLTGVVRSLSEQCYFVRATDTASGRVYNSVADCGGKTGTGFVVTGTQVRSAAVTVKLCRGTAPVAIACSSAISLGGLAV